MNLQKSKRSYKKGKIRRKRDARNKRKRTNEINKEKRKKEELTGRIKIKETLGVK